MNTLRTALVAAAIAAGLVAPIVTSPAIAAIDNSDPQRFVTSLTGEGFAAMRSGSEASAKAQFRTLLATNVAVDEMGDRLIRRWLPTITPAQRAAYKAALPSYIVGTYTDNLLNYRDAQIKVIRAQPAGGGVDVTTQVLKPGRQPLPAVWSVIQVGGAWKVANLRVGGINVAMAQAADFDSVIQRQGFDALIRLMRSRN
jgi:phospholipid transport system substrate-binding protein